MSKYVDSTFIKQLEYIDSLDKNIRDSLIKYTTTDFSNYLNECLITDKQLSDEAIVDYENIRNAFFNVPVLETNIVVYRGVRSDENVSNRGFLSTSLKQEIAIDFAEESKSEKCSLLRIHVSQGSRVLPLWDISRYPYERELLLENLGKIIVTNVSETSQMCKTIVDLSYSPSSAFDLYKPIMVSNIAKYGTTRKEIQKISDKILSSGDITNTIYEMVKNKNKISTHTVVDAIEEYVKKLGYNVSDSTINVIYTNYVNNIMLNSDEQKIIDILENYLSNPNVTVMNYVYKLNELTSNEKVLIVAYFMLYQYNRNVKRVENKYDL